VLDGELVEHVQERLDGELHVVGGRRFERVVADARVLAAHEQHRLGHHLAELHRVVAGAARHAVHRQPAAATARSQRACHSGALGAAATRIVSSAWPATPRRSQIAAARRARRRRSRRAPGRWWRGCRG
jgi:hypothetical protein